MQNNLIPECYEISSFMLVGVDDVFVIGASVSPSFLFRSCGVFTQYQISGYYHIRAGLPHAILHCWASRCEWSGEGFRWLVGEVAGGAYSCGWPKAEYGSSSSRSSIKMRRMILDGEWLGRDKVVVCWGGIYMGSGVAGYGNEYNLIKSKMFKLKYNFTNRASAKWAAH